MERKDLKNYDLSTRAKTSLVNSSYTDIKSLQAAFKNNPDVVYEHFARLPNTGAATIREIFRVLGLDYAFKERRHRIATADELLREIADAPKGWDADGHSKASTVFLIDLLAETLITRNKERRFVLTEAGKSRLEELRGQEEVVIQLRGTRAQMLALGCGLEIGEFAYSLSNAIGLMVKGDNQPIEIKNLAATGD